METFAGAVDRALCAVNVEYQAKRKSERLFALEIEVVGERFFDRYRELRLAEGAPIGQFKWLQLCSSGATLRRLEQLTEKSGASSPAQ